MQDIKGKRLLILGSSVWKDLIRSFADEYGVYLIFAGLYPAPLDDIADEYYRVDTTNRDVMIPFVKAHNIDGVYMGGSEFIISHACEWINELGMPCYCEKSQWEMLQDKSLFKDLCIKYGLPVVPKYTIDPNNIKGSVPEDRFPVITKPTDGSGSNGFSVCNNPDELEFGYKRACESSPTGSVICEKFVNNKGIVVFFVFSKGQMHFAMTENKYPVYYEKQGTYVAGMHLFPSQEEQEFYNLYGTKLQSLFNGIGIKEGTIWIEVFHENNEYYFNEVGFRYSGSFSFYTLDYLKGINQFFSDLYYSISGDSQLYGFSSLIPSNVKKGLRYCIYSIHCKPGKVVKEEGLLSIKEKYQDNLVVVKYQKSIGDIIVDTGSFGQVFCLFHFVYDSLKECKNILGYIQKTYKLIDEEGNNLIAIKLNIEDI